MALLEVHDVSRIYGKIRACDEVSLAVQPGTCHAVIGANGAGKSTLFRVVTGATPASSGRLAFADADITATSQVKRARLGIAQTFQHASVFMRQTVADNVALSAQRSLGCCWNPWRKTSAYQQVTARVEEALTAAGLTHRWRATAAELSHGERQQLEVAIAIASAPRLLLLDEPTAGMSAAETARFTSLIASLLPAITIMIIEHDLKVVFALATEVTVLHLGKLLASGSPAAIKANPAVQAAYLGEDVAALPAAVDGR